MNKRLRNGQQRARLASRHLSFEPCLVWPNKRFQVQPSLRIALGSVGQWRAKKQLLRRDLRLGDSELGVLHHSHSA